MIADYKRLFILLASGLSLLLIPAVAMQFSSEVNWGKEDFIIAGLLIIGTVLFIEIALRKFSNQKNKGLLVLAIVFFAILLFMEMAVGLFGSPIAGD
ncbi:MAG: hypothetical protein HRT75_09590 [Gilvibacter sp.]|nr:hypothetical protein [Gilvibacter sp.]